MLKHEKINLANDIKNLLANKQCVVLLSHEKLTFSQIESARRECAEGTIIKKVPNKIAKKALEGTNYESISDGLKKETILVFGEDSFDACKIAGSLAKIENINVLKGANGQEGEYSKDLISKVGKLGSKEALQSKLLNVINGVASKVVRLLSAKTEQMK